MFAKYIFAASADRAHGQLAPPADPINSAEADFDLTSEDRDTG
jgi:hypothetical protein